MQSPTKLHLKVVCFITNLVTSLQHDKIIITSLKITVYFSTLSCHSFAASKTSLISTMEAFTGHLKFLPPENDQIFSGYSKDKKGVLDFLADIDLQAELDVSGDDVIKKIIELKSLATGQPDDPPQVKSKTESCNSRALLSWVMVIMILVYLMIHG